MWEALWNPFKLGVNRIFGDIIGDGLMDGKYKRKPEIKEVLVDHDFYLVSPIEEEKEFVCGLCGWKTTKIDDLEYCVCCELYLCDDCYFKH